MSNCIVGNCVLWGILTTSCFGEVFGGVEFPQGSSSFADEVISFRPKPGVDPRWVVPDYSLGPPDYNPVTNLESVTLGQGGSITLKFTNNFLTGSNSPAHDLHVFEIGPDVEDTFVEISSDGEIWHSVGKVSGGTSSIDIDAFGFGSSFLFSYVRLTDDPNDGSSGGKTPGADIDAVGAISSALIQDAPALQVEPAIMLRFKSLV